MCARLLSCPLCSQPGFVTLDALRAGLVSVATRPLACPVCNETLLGIDKLTIHLFGHTINAHGRSDPRKVVEVTRSSQTTQSEAMTISQTWNVPEIYERTQSEEITNEKFSFLPLTSLNPSRSITAMVINKNPNPTEHQNYPQVDQTLPKTQNQIIFVRNLNQPQQFCSPRLVQNDTSPGNICDLKTFETSVPLLFHEVENKNISQPCAQNCIEENSTQTDALACGGSYPVENATENCDLKNVEQKSKLAEDYSETWIEKLLQENSEKCETPCGKSTVAAQTYSSESSSNISSNVTRPDHKFSGFQPTNLVQSDIDERTESQAQSQNSHSEVFPQLKALRVLAMKEKTERCNICGIPIPDRNILILHKQVVHMIDEKDVNTMPENLLKNYPCHFCTKIFKNRGSLMVHMRIAHIGCNFGLEANLPQEKDVESSSNENGYNCPTCGKNFKKEQHVTQHLKTHEGKQWECDVCSKMFTTKYFLKKHKRLHSGEMPYKCTICDKTFTFQQSYHKHRLYHKDDKPHTCSTCGRSFKELSTLHNHERIHTGEKPFVCETCGKCFRQRVSYLVHRRIHTGVMPYKCNACGKSFRYKVSQRTHKCLGQVEESIASTAEVSSPKSALPSSSVEIPGKSLGVFPPSATMSEIPSSENKFILIVNTQGQSILTRESDVATNFDESQNFRGKSRSDESANLWDRLSRETNDSTSSSKEDSGDKLRSERSFFSLVIPSMENDVSSPSTEMEHLRLSSPRNEEARPVDAIEIRDNEHSSLQTDLNNAIEGIIRDSCSGNAPLETINEESLKQLLYGIDRKV